MRHTHVVGRIEGIISTEKRRRAGLLLTRLQWKPQSNLHIEDLKIQLTTLSSQLSDSHPSFSVFLKYLQTHSKPTCNIHSEVVTVMKLLLIMPASNATSERSFSALRRVKHTLRQP